MFILFILISITFAFGQLQIRQDWDIIGYMWRISNLNYLFKLLIECMVVMLGSLGRPRVVVDEVDVVGAVRGRGEGGSVPALRLLLLVGNFACDSHFRALLIESLNEFPQPVISKHWRQTVNQ